MALVTHEEFEIEKDIRTEMLRDLNIHLFTPYSRKNIKMRPEVAWKFDKGEAQWSRLVCKGHAPLKQLVSSHKNAFGMNRQNLIGESPPPARRHEAHRPADIHRGCLAITC